MPSHNDNTLSVPSMRQFILLHPPTHLTFSAPDHHGQSAFNPPPCGANQVTTPVRRVQESLAQHGERRRQLYYQRGKANGQPPTTRQDRSSQAKPGYDWRPTNYSRQVTERGDVSDFHSSTTETSPVINVMLIGC